MSRSLDRAAAALSRGGINDAPASWMTDHPPDVVKKAKDLIAMLINGMGDERTIKRRLSELGFSDAEIKYMMR